MESNPRQVKDRLNGRLEELLRYLLPAGVFANHEFRVGSVSGEAGKSLVVELRGERRGLWQDFAHPGDPGQRGDVLDLWAAVRGRSFREIYREAAEWAGFRMVDRGPVKPKPGRPPTAGISRMSEGVAEYWRERGIGTDTLELYKVRSHVRPSPYNTEFSLFAFLDPEGEAVMVKSTGLKKRPDGTKDIWTSTPWYTLWGWWLVGDSCREVVVTEGEADAMSLHQMNPGMPVLSLPAGVANLEWIENDYERLSALETIWVVTDNDEPHARTGLRAGEEGARAIAKRLGPARVRRVPVAGGLKDVNEVLLGGDDALCDWETAWKAKAYSFDPPTIRGADEFRAEAMRRLARLTTQRQANGFIWPSTGFEFRNGELTCVSGMPGGGKSAWLYQTHGWELSRGERMFFASYEITPEQMEIEFASVLCGRDPDEERLGKAIDWLTGRCWFYRPAGSGRARERKRGELQEELFDSMDYAVQRFGTTRIIVDSLHFVVPKEDYEGQDAFMERLLDFARSRDVHVAVVCHSRVKEGVEHVPGMDMVEGSGGIVKPIDNGVTIWRNALKTAAIEKAREAEDAVKLEEAKRMHDGLFVVWKQRLDGRLGRTRLWFETESKSFRLGPDGGSRIPGPLEARPGPEGGEGMF